jgi:hypothetical protein
MPSADTILAGLSQAANTWRWLAVAWHLLFAALLVAFLAGWRFSTRLIAWVATASVVSVSALSWLSKNPFNALIFSALAVALVAAAMRARATPVVLEAPVRAVPGAVLLALGWTYPHFLSAQSWTEYLYAAPLAVVPCATLSAAIGLTLMIRNLGSAAWMAPLAAAGAFYGVFGVFVLRVFLDATLLAASLALVAVIARDRAAGQSVRGRKTRVRGDVEIRLSKL